MQIHVVGEIFPCSADTRHNRLASETSVCAHFACNTRHLSRERAQLLDHRVERVLQQQNFAAHIDRDLLRKIAARDCCRHFRDVANLSGQVRSHEVHIVGQIFPRASNSRHLRLPAKLAFGSDFTRHTRDFRRKGIELVHHRIDGVLEFENFAFDIDRDLAGQVAARDSCGHFRDIPHLCGQIARH